MIDDDRLWLAYYGDDFTGSTDCLEALSLAGVRAVLLFGPPTADTLARFPGVQVVGVAGVGRSLSPEQMACQLPPIFESLQQLGAPLVHYKVCSTFDSSPTIGSIGRAIGLGQRVFGTRTVPLVVGVPALGRYCLFGHLFARAGGDGAVYRIDRHPTMSCHPVTPMHESDLRKHLALQTNQPMGLVDAVLMAAPHEEIEKCFAQREAAGDGIVLFDTLTDAHLTTIGAIVWHRAKTGEKPLFVVGSSGVEYALAAHWREVGILPQRAPMPALSAANQILVVCGSCSPVTGQQINDAVSQGFVDVPLPPGAWASGDQQELATVLAGVRAALQTGKSVIVHSARGPNDPRIGTAKQQMAQTKCAEPAAARLGGALAEIVRQTVIEAGIRRVAVAGGDTSGYLAGALGISALEFVTPIAPGVPLCRARAAAGNSPFDGLEICFKGGQVGQRDFFNRVLHGQ